jgi:hypothetical protein
VRVKFDTEIDSEVNRNPVCSIVYIMRFVAFRATEYDEVFSGYQPGQMVER